VQGRGEWPKKERKDREAYDEDTERFSYFQIHRRHPVVHPPAVTNKSNKRSISRDGEVSWLDGKKGGGKKQNGIRSINGFNRWEESLGVLLTRIQ